MTLESDLNEAIAGAYFALENVSDFDLESSNRESLKEFNELNAIHDDAVSKVIELATKISAKI